MELGGVRTGGCLLKGLDLRNCACSLVYFDIVGMGDSNQHLKHCLARLHTHIVVYKCLSKGILAKEGRLMT